VAFDIFAPVRSLFCNENGSGVRSSMPFLYMFNRRIVETVLIILYSPYHFIPLSHFQHVHISDGPVSRSDHKNDLEGATMVESHNHHKARTSLSLLTASGL
jgi:hypothetical protein